MLIACNLMLCPILVYTLTLTPSLPFPLSRAVWYALLGAHAYRMLTGACNPMLRPIHVFRPAVVGVLVVQEL